MTGFYTKRQMAENKQKEEAPMIEAAYQKGFDNGQRWAMKMFVICAIVTTVVVIIFG